MNKHCPARPLVPPTTALLLPLLLGLTTGCASQSASSGRTAPPAARQVQQTVLHEEYDPRLHRSDGLLIEPAFAPPTISDLPPVPTDPPAVDDWLLPPRPDGDADAAPLPVQEESIVIYRVQVMVLSDEGSALALADQLERDLGVPVTVVEEAGLFAVRAGDTSVSEVADDLREQIAALSSQYSEAFVVPAVELVEMPAAADDAAQDTLDASDVPAPEVGLVRTTGWRVLLREFQRLEDATTFRQRVVRRLQRSDGDLDVIFEPPWYKVLMGHYRTEREAQAAAERLRGMGYRSAVKKRGEVYLPEQDQ